MYGYQCVELSVCGSTECQCVGLSSVSLGLSSVGVRLSSVNVGLSSVSVYGVIIL